MMKRMLAVLFMAMVISVCLVSADAGADETLPEENVVYGSDYQVVYGENTLYAPITTFVL